MKTETNTRAITGKEYAVALLDEMIARCKEINAGSPASMQGMDKAIGSVGYFWPRLAAIRDAVAREVV